MMPMAKIAITIDERLLSRLDESVASKRFPNRSRAITDALQHNFRRFNRRRLARECAKLDPREEQAMAEEGLA
jgi:metal-responsive CopG/Arc/MetJ family transcriptional regulator